MRCKSNEVYMVRSPGYPHRHNNVCETFGTSLTVLTRYWQPIQTESLRGVDRLRTERLGSSTRQMAIAFEPIRECYRRIDNTKFPCQ